MPDINDIRKTIDRLHAEEERCRFDPLSTSGECAVAIHELRRSLFLHWPTISRALAEAESDRRKAAVCDDLLRAYSRLVNGTIMADSFACEAMRIAKTAITAALAAKESK